jgi:hypothetical protein
VLLDDLLADGQADAGALMALPITFWKSCINWVSSPAMGCISVSGRNLDPG